MTEATDNTLGFTQNDLTDQFFSQVAESLGLELTSWAEGKGNIGYHLMIDLSQVADTRINGVYRFNLRGNTVYGEEECFDLAVRFKLNSIENSVGCIALFEAFGEEIHDAAKRFLRSTLHLTRASELEVLTARRAMKDTHLAQFLPNVYYTVLDNENEHYVVVTDFIDQNDTLAGGKRMPHSDQWNDPLIFMLLKELARFHSHYVENTYAIEVDFGGALRRDPRQQLYCREYFRAVIEINEKVLPHLYSAKRMELLRRYLDNMEKHTEELEAYPMTFVHNDTHTGNLWLRRQAEEGKSHLILFDWELCCIDVPQGDLVFALLDVSPQSSAEGHLRVYKTYTAYYHQQLLEALKGRDQSLINRIKDWETFDRIVYLQMFEILLNRMSVVGALPEEHRQRKFEATIENAFRYIEAQTEIYDIRHAVEAP